VARHAGPSLVVVKTGQLTMYEPGKGACEVSVHGAGTTFVDPEGAHNFTAAGETEFLDRVFRAERRLAGGNRRHVGAGGLSGVRATS
jgi:hypothetical protein